MKRMDMKFIVIIFVLAGLISSACRLTGRISDDGAAAQMTVEAQVAATVAVMQIEESVTETEPPEDITEEDVLPTATSDVATDEELLPTATLTLTAQETISGQLFFPGGYLPPQRLVAYDVDDIGAYYATEVYSGNTYSLEVSPGTYYVLAYLIDEDGNADPSGYSGAYSEFVPCGLHVDCDDHSLIPVEVVPGQTITGIDPADWYLPNDLSGYWPSDPTLDEDGTIVGRLSYPSDYIPPLRVIAFNLDTDDYYEVYTELNDFTYQITDLPPGTYHVLAYLVDNESDFCAAYTQYALCGYWLADCEFDPELVDVAVFPGQIVRQVDLVDWDRLTDHGWPAEPER